MKYLAIEELERAHYIINVIREACLEVDSSMVIVFANKRAEELFGKRKNNIVGRYIWEVFSEPLHTAGTDAINNALIERRSSQADYFSPFFQATVSLQVIATENGALLLIYSKTVKSVVDQLLLPCLDSLEKHESKKPKKITTRLDKQLKKLRAYNNELQTINKELLISTKEKELTLQKKDEFLGIASHELKTPVTSIKAYAQTLHMIFKEKGDESSAVFMEKINTQVNRLVDLINALLDTTKISEGQLPLHPEQFDLNELIAEHVADLQYISEKHRIVFTPGDIPLITADRERIGQVLTNLISNAIKYSPAGGDVAITTFPVEEGVRVSVQDRGLGIPQDVKDKVFDRFFRVSDHRISALSGMGLGLYITAGIIHRHGGTISVESTSGEGSMFSFMLPLSSCL